jgi:hypothetical protein
MTDLMTTIAPKSDQLNADDLIGRTLTIAITGVRLLGEADQPIAIHFEGDGGRPYKPCKSMRRVMVQVWKGDGNEYVGRRMTLYRDDKVQFGGLAVGGIRISHMSDIGDKEVTMALTASRVRKPYTVKPLPAATPTSALRVDPLPPKKLTTPADFAADCRDRFERCTTEHEHAELATWWNGPTTKKWRARVREVDAALADALEGEFGVVCERVGM